MENNYNDMYRQEPVELFNCECCVVNGITQKLTECTIPEEVTVPITALFCEGKELKVRVTFDEVCRNYKLAVSVFVGYPFEFTPTAEEPVPPVPENMEVYAYKVCIVDAGTEIGCVPLVVDGFCFDLEEPLCSEKWVPVKVIAHYVDLGFTI